MPQFVLTLSCPNRPGIVAAVSGHLFEAGYNILDAQQFDDTETDVFFMRVVFNRLNGEVSMDPAPAFEPVAQRFHMSWSIRASTHKRRVMILVSKFDHCLADLLYRWRIDELAMIPTAIVANYPAETYAHLDLSGIPFHYLPVTPQTKQDQEAAIERLIAETGTELVVLARYMQILSDGLSSRLAGRCINIHHSFLPGFKGAKPYHQAHARGVNEKLQRLERSQSCKYAQSVRYQV